MATREQPPARGQVQHPDGHQLSDTRAKYVPLKVHLGRDSTKPIASEESESEEVEKQRPQSWARVQVPSFLWLCYSPMPPSILSYQ